MSLTEEKQGYPNIRKLAHVTLRTVTFNKQ